MSDNNPLYPPRKKSAAAGVLIALVSVIICIVLIALIVSYKSEYSGHRGINDIPSPVITTENV